MQVSASDTVPGEVSKPRRKGPPPTPAADVTLREILQELRNQRTMGGEFSYMMILAIVLQVAAIVCLLAALMLGRDNLTAFSQWMSIALLVQLATVAMLLFDRKG